MAQIRIIILALLAFTHLPAFSQQPAASDLLTKEWKASWITVPGTSPDGYGVYWFRRTIDLASLPASLPVYVSGDNRYKLYVNDSLVSLGPTRGDVMHWNYATVDLAPALHPGKNTITAMVWNEGTDRAESQISYRTGFILQGTTPEGQLLNTDTSWKCRMDSCYTPIKIKVRGYYVAGPGELIDRTRLPARPEWKTAQPIATGVPRNIPNSFAPSTAWLLVPSTLPPMEMTRQRIKTVRRAEGINVPAGWPENAAPVTIPANTTATLLLDQASLTNAYPTLIFSGGQRASLSLIYAEALYKGAHEKGNRDDIEGKIIIGRKDSLISDGSSHQVFTPMTWRTYRYIQLRITTGEQSLTLDDIYGTFTGYPFDYKAKLETDRPELDTMMNIGWHTARLCAMETYMDCPYYEQLQYIGDTRIQALVTLYNTGDDRIVKNAIDQLDISRRPEGVTLSRYPTQIPQLIPPFALWWIAMLHDYYLYGSDSTFVKNKLPGMRQVLSFFRTFQQADGSIHGLPYWSFTDWVTSPGWSIGMAPIGADGSSSVLDLQLLWAYQLAADLENKIGMKEYAASYRQSASKLQATIRSKYWDSKRALFADRPEKDLFSQHANALAILTDVASPAQTRTVAQLLLKDTGMAPASIYFKYYLHLAEIKAGNGNDYLHWLGKWRENIRMGLTTWAEMSDISGSRSDCHAWGASPNIEFFRNMMGFDSDGAGFNRIKIEPHPGDLHHLKGEIPHPKGKIAANYTLQQNKWDLTIELPKSTSGRLVWLSHEYPLKGGVNHYVLPAH